MLVQWATVEGISILNTKFPQDYGHCTHWNGKRYRQIDFICIDWAALKYVTEVGAIDGIGVGIDHRAVRAILHLKAVEKNRKNRIRRTSVGWKPQDSFEYARSVGAELSLLKAQDLWKEMALQSKCEAVEKVLVEVAEKCRDSTMGLQEERRYDKRHLHDLMEERRRARQ